MKKKIIEMITILLKKINKLFLLLLHYLFIQLLIIINKLDFLGFFDINIKKLTNKEGFFLIWSPYTENSLDALILITFLESQVKKPIFNEIQLFFAKYFFRYVLRREIFRVFLFLSVWGIFIMSYQDNTINAVYLFIFFFPLFLLLINWYKFKQKMFNIKFTYFATTLFFFFKSAAIIVLYRTNQFDLGTGRSMPGCYNYRGSVANKNFTIDLFDFNYTIAFGIDTFTLYFLLLTTLIFFLVAVYEIFNSYNFKVQKQFINEAELTLTQRWKKDYKLLTKREYNENFIFYKNIYNEPMQYSETKELLNKKYLLYLDIVKRYYKFRYFELYLHEKISLQKINIFIFYIFLEWFICLAFLTQDLLIFYIAFECSIIPMMLLIFKLGSRQRKIHATYLFFIYTFIGSLFMLSALFLIYTQTYTFNLEALINFEQFSLLSELTLKYMWFAIFITFAFKIPVIPFHLWLPEAHVEASTSGSVILAALLLKLGSYGMLRFLIPMFPKITIFFMPIIQVIAMISIIYSAIIAIRQIDIKRIIAYSSINHMSFCLLGLFSFTSNGIYGSVLLMISHGFVSAALFFCIGFLYARTHTRLITQYSGLTLVMPLFIIFFGIAIFSNIAFPGTVSFFAEFTLILGICQNNFIFGFFCIINLFFVTIFSVLLFNKLAFNYFKNDQTLKCFFNDLNFYETIILLFLTYYIIKYGIVPNSLFGLLIPAVKGYVLLINTPFF